jgi:tetratricopeptide (TPR) repeat protein
MITGGMDEPVIRFLRGRLALKMNRYDEAVQIFSSFSIFEDDPFLEALRFQSMGIALFRRGDYDAARTQFWTSLNFDDSDATEHGIDEWIDRCEWKLGRGMSPGGNG